MFEHCPFSLWLQKRDFLVGKGRDSARGQVIIFKDYKSYRYWMFYKLTISLPTYRTTYIHISYYCLLENIHQQVGEKKGEIKLIDLWIDWTEALDITLSIVPLGFGVEIWQGKQNDLKLKVMNLASLIWNVYAIYPDAVATWGAMEEDSSKGSGQVFSKKELGFVLGKRAQPWPSYLYAC